MIVNKLYWSKYRPKKIEAMILLPRIQKEILNKQGELQLSSNYLFVGSPGLGKTSLAKIIAPEGALHVNASYNSSIDDLRDQVTEYCKTGDIFGKSSVDGYKIVFLDEFDGVSQKYQDALRGFIEDFESRVRFIATCCTKDTKVYTKYGYQLIQNIKNEKLYTHIYNNFQENKQIIINDVDHTIKFKTLHKFEIEVTPTHQFLNNNKWYEANELNILDNIDIDLKPIYGNNFRIEKYYNNNFIDIKKFIIYLKQNGLYFRHEIDKIKNDKILKLNKTDYIIFKKLKKYKNDKQIKNRTKYFSFDEIFKICESHNRGSVYTKNMINRFLNIGILLKHKNFYYFSNKSKAIKCLENYVNNYIKRKYYNKNIESVKKIIKSSIFSIEDILDKLDNVLNIKNNELDKISALGRILGMLYGDGHLNNTTMFFAAFNDTVLEKVKDDLNLLFDDNTEYNFYQNGKHSKGRALNVYGKHKVLLFNFLGCPIGNKVVCNNLEIPNKCYKHKHFFRTFIQGIFDCEMNTYRFDKNNKTLKNLVFRQHTSNINYKFHNQIIKLLKKYFNIDAKTYIKDKYIDKTNFIDKSKIKKYLSTITINNNENILKYMENIGNYYENKNIRYDIYGYLLYKRGQIGYNFLTFNEWKYKYYKNDGIIFDVIKNISILKKKYKRKVYDCSLNDVHSYNTNGFISHNCNNIGKISDAMKSRFTVIDFNPQNREEEQYLREQYIERVNLVVEKNNININQQQIESIIDINFPDLRSVMNALQRIEHLGEFTQDVNQSINVDLFNIVFAAIDTEKTYNWVISNFGDNVEYLLRLCGRPLCEYIINNKKEYISKLPQLLKITTQSMANLSLVSDPLVLAVSTIYEIQLIFK